VLAADVYASPPWVGRGGWTWYTGAAAWTWRLAIEQILGLRRLDGALVVDPCIPPEWPDFEAWIRHGDLSVHVTVHNEGGTGRGVHAARLDGRDIERPCVPLTGEGERRLEVWLSEAARPAADTLPSRHRNTE
jgi:cyclic beta-1,2-glucan synthetase